MEKRRQHRLPADILNFDEIINALDSYFVLETIRHIGTTRKLTPGEVCVELNAM